MAKQERPLTGVALVKEVCRRIRVGRSYWDAHNNAACRGERVKRSYSEGNRALALYNTLTKEQKDQIPRSTFFVLWGKCDRAVKPGVYLK